MTNSRNFIITTTNLLEGYEVSNYLGVVSAHIVTGTGFFSDFAASLSDVFGGRSNSYEKQLNSIKQEVISRLKSEALSKNANAILGMCIDFDEISGKGKTMFMVTAVGTAVRIKNIKNDKTQSDNENTEESVSSEQIRRAMMKNTYLGFAEKGTLSLYSEANWKEIIDLNLVELLPYMIEESGKIMEGTVKSGVYVDPDTIKRNKTTFRTFFSIFISHLPKENVIEHLYKMANDPRTTDLALELMKEYELLDYKKVLELLDSDNLYTKKIALKILFIDKPVYTLRDKCSVEEIINKIHCAFPELGNKYEKKSMLSSKLQNVWSCKCGAKGNESEYCDNCGKNICGFLEKDIKPEEVISYLQNKDHIINNLLEVNGINEK